MRNNTSISRQLKEKITAFKGSNMSYREISEEIGCCKSTIHYHLTPGAAEKIRKRSGREEWRSVWRFCYEPKKKKKPLKYKIDTLLRKKFRAFLYGATRKNQTRRNKMGLKHTTTKIFHVLAKLWPGIVKENQVFHAVNQWTNKKDYYNRMCGVIHGELCGNRVGQRHVVTIGNEIGDRPYLTLDEKHRVPPDLIYSLFLE